MTKQEQIEEMAKILHSTHAESVICIGKDCNFCKHADLKIFDDYTCIDLDLAEALHNEGYRKVDEVRKETAKEILDLIAKIIKEEYGDEPPCGFNCNDEYMLDNCGEFCDEYCNIPKNEKNYERCWVEFFKSKMKKYGVEVE